MRIIKFVNIDGGFDVLALDTIFNFPQLAILENEEEEIGGNTVERVTSLIIVCKGGPGSTKKMRSQHYLKPPPDILNSWSHLKHEFFPAPKGNCIYWLQRSHQGISLCPLLLSVCATISLMALRCWRCRSRQPGCSKQC